MMLINIPKTTPTRGGDVLTWAREAQQAFRDIRSAFGSILPARPRAVEEGASTPKIWQPWDLYKLTGVGTPDPETGKYSSYKAIIWPGAVGGLVPGNMFAEFTVSGTGTQYLIVAVTTGSGAVQSATLSIAGTPATPPAQTLDAPPTTFNHTLGVFVDATYFRVQSGNVSLTAEESLRVSDPAASPFGLPYKSYYIWRAE